MDCRDCPYYWSDDDNDLINFEHCHYQWNDGCAPCEICERVKDAASYWNE